MHVLNGLLIFHSEVDDSNLLPSPVCVGLIMSFYKIIMWEQFKILMKRVCKTELYGLNIVKKCLPRYLKTKDSAYAVKHCWLI